MWLPLQPVCTAQISPVGEGEPGRADVQDGRRIRSRPAFAALAQVDADRELAALRRTLLAPAAAEVEDLPGNSGNRQAQDEVVELVWLAPGW